MYPMDYEEFLWANGIQEHVIEHMKECFERRARIDSFIHKIPSKEAAVFQGGRAIAYL